MSDTPTYKELTQKFKEGKKSNGGHRPQKNQSEKYEEKYKAIFECVLDCVYIHDFEGNFIDANDVSLNLLGYRRDEIPSLNFRSLLSQDQLPLALEALEEIKRTGSQKGFTEYILRDRYGNNIYVETKASVIYQDSEPWAILGTARDITKRKQTEELLKRKIIELNTFISTIPDMAWLKDTNSCFIDVNKAFCEVTGMEPEALINHTCEVCFGAQAAKKFKEDDQKVMEGGTKVIIEEKIIDSENNEVWLETIKSPILDEAGKPTGTIGIARDITKRKRMEDALKNAYGEMEQRVKQRTAELKNANEQLRQEIEERKEAEKALRESEERFRDLYENAPNAYFSVDRDGYIRRSNRHAEELLGYTAKQLLGCPVYKLYAGTPQGKQRAARILERFQAGETITDQQLQMRRADGTVIWISLTMNVVLDDRGQVIESRSMVVDINDRKRAEERLIASEENYRAIFESVNDAIMIHDPKTGRPLDMNPKMLEILGYNKEELTHMKVADWTVGNPAIMQIEAMRKIKDAALGKPQLFEWNVRTKNNKLIWVEVNLKAATIRGKKCVLAVVRNITERKRAEEQIASSLKEKEVLLREIHHRVKNNMQIIISMLRIHSRRTHDKRMKRIFDECRNRINAMSLIHETLYQSEDLARIDFENYLKKLCRSLIEAHGASDKGIELTVAPCRVVPNMDQGIAVGMVICELVANAFQHAFTDGKRGKVSVSLSTLEGELVELIVSDNGIGMPMEIDIENSPSLGLQLTVATVTRELDGSIKVERDGGTQFIIRFKCKSS